MVTRRGGLVVVAVVLLAIAAVIWAMRMTGGKRMPAAVAGEVVRRIDFKTLEVIELPRSEWMGLRGKYNLYKNPKTGRFTVVDVMRCASCGEEIPVFPVTEEAAAEGPAGVMKLRRAYRCPKCSKPAYPSGGPGG